MDPYVYPGTSVLRNVRELRDAATLDRFEADVTARRLLPLQRRPLQGSFDLRHLQAIHRYIFQDIYPWAGEFRTVDISKGGDLFGLSQHIVPALTAAFDNLKAERFLEGADIGQFCHRGAYYLGELNAVHPFREGNGRTQREFLRELADRNGYALDWRRVSREEMIEASRESLRRTNAGLERLLTACLLPKP